MLAARLGDDGSMIVTVTDSSAGTTVILRLPAERIVPETR